MHDALSEWSDRWGMISCLIVAIALRSVIVWTSSAQLTQDRDAYLGIARAVADGRGFCNPDHPAPTAFRPPVYPLQLASLMLFVPAAVAVAIANLGWGIVATWATGRVAHILGLGRWGILAALLVAVDPLLLEYSTQPMTEVTCSGLLILFVLWTVRSDVWPPLREFIAGLLFGLLAMCRPTFWPVFAFLLIGWSAARILLRSGEPIRSLRFGELWRFTAGMLLIATPWVVRNQLVMGTPILTTTHGGYTLLLGNNPVFSADVVRQGWGTAWSQASFDRWQSQLQTDLQEAVGPNGTEQERDRWQSMQARAYIAKEPGEFVRAAWYRVQSLWSPVPQEITNSTLRSNFVLLVGVYYTIILVAFLAGLVSVAVSARDRRWWPLYALVMTIQLVHLAYWTNARMRAPLVPVISLFAVAALSRGTESIPQAQTT